MDEKKRVLVVDDEPDIRQLVSRLVKMAGYQPFQASDGMDAIAVVVECQLGGYPIDLVITDVRMPRMGGEELVAHFRTHGHNIPTIMMSGTDVPQIVEPARYFVGKPIKPQQFVPLLKSILG